MPIPLESYTAQAARWPSSGRHILAHFDSESVVVYQAYKPSIGRFAVEHQRFGGEFSFSRMSWVKPNFNWMMYRSGWGTKADQEVTLGLRLRRAYFDSLLAQAVPSTFVEELYADRAAWQADVARSDVRLQWDPDHHPSGAPVVRRAIQLGVRGEALARLAPPDLVEVLDFSPVVARLRAVVVARDWGRLETPVESVYVPADRATRVRLGLSEDASA